MKSYKNQFLISLLFLSMCLFLFRNIIFSQDRLISSPGLGDMFVADYAHKSLTFSRLLRGQLPLWNPYTFCGYPWFANPANQMSYPPNVIFLFLPRHNAINYSFIIHILLAGMGMYLFILSLLKNRFPALIAALIFMFSPLFFLRCFAGHLTVLHAYSWIPFIFLTTELFLRRKNAMYVLFTALFLGIQLLAGYPQVSLYTILGISSYFIIFSLLDYVKNKDTHILLQRLKSLILILGLGIGLSAIRIVPALEFTRLSNRGGTDFVFVGSWSFPLSNLITYFLPEFYGDAVNVRYWGEYNLWEMCGYVGIMPLILSMFAIFGKRNKHTMFFVFLSLLVFLGSLGNHTFLFKLFYYLLPGYNKFRGHSKFLILFVFSIPVLSAYGVSWLLEKREEQNQKLKRAILILGFFASIAVCCVIYIFLNYQQVLLWWSKLWQDRNWSIEFMERSFACVSFSFIKMAAFITGSFLLLWFWINKRITLKGFKFFVVFIIIADLWLFGAKYLVSDKIEKCYWDREIVGFLKGRLDAGPYRVEIPFFSTSFAHNKAILDAIYVFYGYDHLVLKRFDSFCLYFSRSLGNPQIFKILGMTNIKYLICPAPIQFNNPVLRVIYQKYNLKIWENTNCLPRAYIVHNAKIIKGQNQDEKILGAIFEDNNFDPKTTVILEHDTPIETSLSDTSQNVDEEADFLEYLDNKVTIRAVLKNDGFLVLSDVNYPGWNANVLDLKTGKRQKTEVLYANYLFRGIPLRAGNYVVTFIFRPISFYLGMVISAITLLVVMGSLILYIKKEYVSMQAE